MARRTGSTGRANFEETDRGTRLDAKQLDSLFGEVLPLVLHLTQSWKASNKLSRPTPTDSLVQLVEAMRAARSAIEPFREELRELCWDSGMENREFGEPGEHLHLVALAENLALGLEFDSSPPEVIPVADPSIPFPAYLVEAAVNAGLAERVEVSRWQTLRDRVRDVPPEYVRSLFLNLKRELRLLTRLVTSARTPSVGSEARGHRPTRAPKKRRGPKAPTMATVEHEDRLLEEYQHAWKTRRLTKAEFAREVGMSDRELKRLLDRARHRRRAPE